MLIYAKEPDELRNVLSNLVNNVFKQIPVMPMHKRLWNIRTTVLRNRRLSAQEAAFRGIRLSNLKLIQLTRDIVYINCRFPSK